ncbi:MAG: HAD-IB family hydrolase [Acidobacteria bacterium]|nr:HAD-IB family hydrolase [Acidobacteriota bacterium]
MTVQAAAFFDVDGTILEGNIVRYYAYLRTCKMTQLEKALWIALFLPKVPYYMLLDAFSRRRFSQAFYRNYTNLSPTQLDGLAQDHFRALMQPRIYPAFLDQLRKHQDRNDLIVLVTNSLEVLVKPLADQIQASAMIAARLRQQGGAFTGELEKGPLTDRSKAEAIVSFSKARQLDLSKCYAYADSLDDIPMLEAAGYARVVNPGRQLRKIALAKKWKILIWNLEENRKERTS